jgi:hypothetical protein
LIGQNPHRSKAGEGFFSVDFDVFGCVAHSDAAPTRRR